MKQETVQQTMWLQQRFNVMVGQAHKVSLWVRGMKTVLTTNLGGIRPAPSCLRCFLGHSCQPRLEARKTTLSADRFNLQPVEPTFSPICRRHEVK